MLRFWDFLYGTSAEPINHWQHTRCAWWKFILYVHRESELNFMSQFAEFFLLTFWYSNFSTSFSTGPPTYRAGFEFSFKAFHQHEPRADFTISLCVFLSSSIQQKVWNWWIGAGDPRLVAFCHPQTIFPISRWFLPIRSFNLSALHQTFWCKYSSASFPNQVKTFW